MWLLLNGSCEMKLSLLAWPRPCRSESETLRQFWLTFTLLPRRWLHSPAPVGAKLAGRPPARSLGPMLSGGVFAAPSAPGPWSSSPPPGMTLGLTPSRPSSASNSPEINRRWILLSCLTLNGAAPAEITHRRYEPGRDHPRRDYDNEDTTLNPHV